MTRSLRYRLLLASAATAAAISLAGCVTEGADLSARAMTPISSKMLAEIEQKNMTKDSPILVRIFKQEAELEVWKQDRTGHYALLKTYPICRWSGELGPKIREGDRQAPEGFYSITPAQMNPKSQYYLAFNMGYPNAYDRAWGRTGAELMIHGDCSSRGCYAMTDEQIAEIYALGREAFFGGQRAFQVQAYPFRMTAENFAKHRNNPNLAFWKMLKRGNDHFEVSRLEPKIDVCEKHYVFDAQAPGNASTALSFNPAGKCPVYEAPSDIVTAVNEKQRRDEYQTAELITRGARTSPVRTGADGGMHPVFMAALQKPGTGPSDAPLRSLSLATPTPGTIPQHAVPPRAPTVSAAPSANVPAARPAPAPSAPPQVATAAVRPIPAPSHTAPSRTATAGLFGSIYASSNTRAAATQKDVTSAIPPSTTAQPASQPTNAQQAIQPMQMPTVTYQPQTAASAAIRPRPVTPAEQPAKPAENNRSAQSGSLVQNTSPTATSTATPDAAPMAPAGSFESRWSAITNRSRF